MLTHKVRASARALDTHAKYRSGNRTEAGSAMSPLKNAGAQSFLSPHVSTPAGLARGSRGGGISASRRQQKQAFAYRGVRAWCVSCIYFCVGRAALF